MRKEYAGEAINRLHNQYKYLTHQGFIEKNRESLRAAQWAISCAKNLSSDTGNNAQFIWEQYKKVGFDNVEAFEKFMECVYNLESDLDLYFKSGWNTTNQGINEESYVNKSILKGFQSKKGYFNYQKLITLIEELNFSYAYNKAYSSCTILRAILDHIPPLLGKDNFDAVASKYKWGSEKSSKRKAVGKLLEFRNTPDDVLHGQITDKDDVVDITYLPDKFAINVLLKECLASNTTFILKSKTLLEKRVNKENAKVDLIIDFAEQKVSWANYAISRWVWPSFRMVLLINNFHNKSPEYLKVYLLAKSNDGEWEARNFVFLNREDENKSRPNEDLRIEPGYKEKVSLFISSYDIGLREQKPMPDIDRDTLKLVVETESGKTLTLPIKAGWIGKG